MAYIDTRRFASLEEAIAGIEIPLDIRATLSLASVPFFSFDGTDCLGQLVIHKELQEEAPIIFNELFRMQFPIWSVTPVQAFGWSDEASMLANNSSAFNMRYIDGTERLSQHSYAWAIDINPMFNPCLDYRTGTSEPTGAELDLARPGTFFQDSSAVTLFRDYGWVWGGDWTSLHDAMHFEKRLDGKLS